jgi:hypothetical protein
VRCFNERVESPSEYYHGPPGGGMQRTPWDAGAFSNATLGALKLRYWSVSP